MTRRNGFGLTPNQTIAAVLAIAMGTWLLYECGTPLWPASSLSFSVVLLIAGSVHLVRVHREKWRSEHGLDEKQNSK